MYLTIEGKQYKVNPTEYRESINKVLFDNFIQTIIKGSDSQSGEGIDLLIVLDDRDEMKFNILIKKEEQMEKFKTVNSRQVLVTPASGEPYLIDAVSFNTPKGWFLVSKGIHLLDPTVSDLKGLKEYKGEGKYCFVNSKEVVIFSEPLNVSIGKTISITKVDSLTDLEKTFIVDPWTSMLDVSTGVFYTGLAVKEFLTYLTKSSNEQEVLYKITNHTTCEKIIIKTKGAGYYISNEEDKMFVTGVSAENNLPVTIGFTHIENVSLEVIIGPGTIDVPTPIGYICSNLNELPFPNQEEADSNTQVLTLTKFSGPERVCVKNFVSGTISYLPHNTADYRITVIGENQNGEPVNFTFSANDRVSLIKPGTDFIISNPSEAIEYIVTNYTQAHSTVTETVETTGISKIEKVVKMFNTLTGKNLTATDILTLTELISLVDKEG